VSLGSHDAKNQSPIINMAIVSLTRAFLSVFIKLPQLVFLVIANNFVVWATILLDEKTTDT
jgi:hypothetical protein